MHDASSALTLFADGSSTEEVLQRQRLPVAGALWTLGIVSDKGAHRQVCTGKQALEDGDPGQERRNRLGYGVQPMFLARLKPVKVALIHQLAMPHDDQTINTFASYDELRTGPEL